MESIPHASGIYQILCVPTGKIYIGSSSNIRRRWHDHKARLSGQWRQPHSNRHLQNAWNKHGADAFVFSILEYVAPDDLEAREQYYLDLLNPCDPDIGYNLCPTANSLSGYKRSEAQRAAIAARQRQFMNRPEQRAAVSKRKKGYTPSPESIEKFKAWRRANPAPVEQRQAHSARMTGRKQSPEIIAKRFANRKSRIVSSETRAKLSAATSRTYTVTSPSGASIHVTDMVRFCADHGLHRSAMCRVAKGTQKQHKGWYCRYAEDEVTSTGAAGYL